MLAPAKPLQGLSAADGPAALIAAMAGAVALLHTRRRALLTSSAQQCRALKRHVLPETPILISNSYCRILAPCGCGHNVPVFHVLHPSPLMSSWSVVQACHLRACRRLSVPRRAADCAGGRRAAQRRHATPIILQEPSRGDALGVFSNDILWRDGCTDVRGCSGWFCVRERVRLCLHAFENCGGRRRAAGGRG